MARHKSEERRQAIIAAAAAMVARVGTSAATAAIAAEAGVPNGSLFTYFETKQELLNCLYRELKLELTGLVRTDWPARGSLEDKFGHLWLRWTQWGADFPLKRRALAQLSVSDEITAESRTAGMDDAEFTLEVLRRVGRQGAFNGHAEGVLFATVEALAGVTMDAMIRTPNDAGRIQAAGLKAAWRAIS